MRPSCRACGRPGPTIGGNCPRHLSLATEIALHTISAETVLDAEPAAAAS